MLELTALRMAIKSVCGTGDRVLRSIRPQPWDLIKTFQRSLNGPVHGSLDLDVHWKELYMQPYNFFFMLFFTNKHGSNSCAFFTFTFHPKLAMMRANATFRHNTPLPLQSSTHRHHIQLTTIKQVQIISCPQWSSTKFPSFSHSLESLVSPSYSKAKLTHYA